MTGVRPDLWCFGKVIGGGLPVGAVGGRAEVLSVLAPDGPVYQAGTLSGNPLATAAGAVVLETLDDGELAHLSARVGAFAPRLEAVLNDGLGRHPGAAGGPPAVARVPVVGPLFGVFFGPAGAPPVTDYDGASAAAATGLYRRFFHALLRRGVAVAPGPYEVAFPSLAHGDHEFERTLEAAEEAATELAD
ncbi:MAG: aminotransferase class III-fold pyridoxal phosphate-dependent enzyme [Acidimicrobiales bacterium]|nr:aminotransferase class III-fold pyridoxal phosphate-dependent enzyme [Acidimicrobiales bacterium]